MSNLREGGVFNIKKKEKKSGPVLSKLSEYHVFILLIILNLSHFIAHIQSYNVELRGVF